MESAIVIEHLVIQYGSFVAVNDLSLSVRKGEIFGLLGPNGAGKTTTFLCLTRQIPISSGSVTILGHVQRGGKPSALDRVISSWFGVAAIDAVHDGAFGQMVALENGRVIRTPLRTAVARLKTVDPDLYDVAKVFAP